MNNDKAILGEYANHGFSLEENGDDTLELWFKDKMVAVFPQLGATRRSIQDACKRFMEQLVAKEA